MSATELPGLKGGELLAIFRSGDQQFPDEFDWQIGIVQCSLADLGPEFELTCNGAAFAFRGGFRLFVQFVINADRHAHVLLRFATLVVNGSNCLLYTSDAADDLLCVDLGGRRIIK